jgi:hypothetical protein
MKIDATDPIPDDWVTQPDPKFVEPDRPEGNCEIQYVGVTPDGKRIKIDYIEVFGVWENGYTDSIIIPAKDIQLMERLNEEI